MPHLRRDRTLAQLQVVCARIERVLAGQDPNLRELELPQDAKPGETPLERLQRFKALLNQTLADLRSGTAPACAGCGGAFSDAELDDMPWVTRCRTCAAK